MPNKITVDIEALDYEVTVRDVEEALKKMFPNMPCRVAISANKQNAHPDGKWKCRACKSVWDGSQLVLDPMSTEVKWTRGDYFCGGSCDRIVIGE